MSALRKQVEENIDRCGKPGGNVISGAAALVGAALLVVADAINAQTASVREPARPIQGRGWGQ